MGGKQICTSVMIVLAAAAWVTLAGGREAKAQHEHGPAASHPATTQPSGHHHMESTPGAPGMHADVPPALNFTMKDIDGKDVPLSQYQGQVILMLNVASKCGNTPQYKGLEEMYLKYKDQGLVIMGFPANEFGHQEPGTDAEIKTFCTSKYDVTFPMFSKIVVKGEGIAPLYAYLTSQPTSPAHKGDITWNFEKFLIGRDGSIVARFAPGTKPDDKKLVAAVEAELAKAKP